MPVRGPLAARRGCTLVELLVALVLCTIALLALVGASALLVRELATERAEMDALTLAGSRLERLIVAGCAGRGSGESTHARGVEERWLVEPLAARAQRLTDTVRFPAPRGSRVVVLQTAARC